MAERPKPNLIHKDAPSNRLLRRLSEGRPWLIFPEPRPFELEPELARRTKLAFISRGPRNHGAELQLADDLYDEYVAMRRPSRSIFAYLEVMASVREIHIPVERKTKPRSVYVINKLVANLIENLAVDHADGVSEGYLKRLLFQANNLIDTEFSWFYPKLAHLEMAMGEAKNMYRWIDGMKKKIDVKRLDVDELREAGDEILDAVWERRNYGLKTCFFPSPLLLPEDQVLTVVDEKLGAGDSLKRDLLPSLLGFFAVTSIPNKEQETQVDEYADGEGFVREFRVHIPGMQALMGIDFNGDLTSGISYIPLRRAFEKKGADGLYELVRLLLLLRLHDLSTDPEIVKRFPSIVDFEKELVESKGKVKKIPVKLLTVPRIKPEEYPPTSEPENRRFVDRHKVVWHVRKLPEGYHPTDRAINYAKEHHVELEVGETIVREHFRGEENKTSVSRPTKAIFR